MKVYVLPCQIIKQSNDAPEIAIFACDAFDLHDMSTISRIGEEKDGYQRIVEPNRKNKIAKYVDTPGALLPTAIVAAAGENSKNIKIKNRKIIPGHNNQWTAILEIHADVKNKPLLIIDGQHRLYGILSSKENSFPVPVTMLLNAKTVTQVLHFIIINNKATRINNSLINELKGNIADLSESEKEDLKNLESQLGVESLTSETFVSLLNSQGYAFNGILDFKTNVLQVVSSQTIKGMLQKSRDKGFLSKIEDDEEQLKAYNYLWFGVKKSFSKRWEFELKLAKKAFSKDEFTKSDFNQEKKLFHSGTLEVLGNLLDVQLLSFDKRKVWEKDINAIEKIVHDLLKNIPEEIWDEISVDNTSKGKREFSKIFENLILRYL